MIYWFLLFLIINAYFSLNCSFPTNVLHSEKVCRSPSASILHLEKACRSPSARFLHIEKACRKPSARFLHIEKGCRKPATGFLHAEKAYCGFSVSKMLDTSVVGILRLRKILQRISGIKRFFGFYVWFLYCSSWFLWFLIFTIC